MLRITPEIRQFRASKTLVEALKEDLERPGIRAALKAVASIAQPRSVPAFQAGTAHDTTIAHDYCEMVGVNTFLLVLDSLKYNSAEASPLDQSATEPEPFEDALPEHLQKRPPSLPPV